MSPQLSESRYIDALVGDWMRNPLARQEATEAEAARAAAPGTVTYRANFMTSERPRPRDADGRGHALPHNYYISCGHAACRR